MVTCSEICLCSLSDQLKTSISSICYETVIVLKFERNVTLGISNTMWEVALLCNCDCGETLWGNFVCTWVAPYRKSNCTI